MQVIYEDNHLIAVNKPAGVLVQGDETGDTPLSDMVKEYIKVRYDKPGEVFLGVIHRIDRPVSGVVVFARTSKALERMNRLFQERKVQKTYWAITAHRPEPLSGRLTHFILKDATKNVSKAFDTQSSRAKDAKESLLDYELIGQIGMHCLLEVRPITGRPHQIRVQLAKIGCPIRGDVKYGFPTPNADGSIYLHCRALTFEHPTLKQDITITADPPRAQFWDVFAAHWR
ncbi:MAG TPA: RNA pseudouridine synthase [Saprospiraceae bacterium]|nr:RNA pseudouridine synthase [Saprospiraceae bacterium]HMP23350.1 RNA pseudouridine synthase [Saprospiraceae bacterium]